MRTILPLLLLLAVGCQRASDDSHLMPKLPPPPKLILPAGLTISVEVDGKPQPPIDAALLGRIKADYDDGERKAWRLPTLLGAAAAREHTVVAVTGDKDMTVLFRQPRKPGDPMPVLAASRRGGVVAALVHPDQPFPPYHGQGRRLMRPGDPLPRIGGVTRIRVYLEE